ncbi:unnamed protein product, partial [Rhizoctonia solani]
MPPSSSLNSRLARAVTIRPSTLLRNSVVPAATLAVSVPVPVPVPVQAPAPAPAANVRVVNPTDAGYSLNVNKQDNQRVLLPNREPFNLLIGPRPTGTPGREDFDLMAVLGLDTYQYRLCLTTMRNIAYSCGVDSTRSITYQEDQNLYESYIRFINTFPEFREFPDQFWAPQAIMYVTLKSSSESWRRNNPELAAARAAARARDKEVSKATTRERKTARPRGRPKRKGVAKGKETFIAAQTIAVSHTNPNPVDTYTAAEDLSNMSIMEQDVAAGLANMSLDCDLANLNDDDHDLATNQPFFDSGADPVAGPSNVQPGVSTPFNAMSTPHAPIRTNNGSFNLPSRSHSSAHSVADRHTPGGSSHALDRARIPPSSIGFVRRTHEDFPTSLNGTTVLANTSPNHAPHANAESSRALRTTRVADGTGPYDPVSRPPPIPHSSRPSSVYSTSFVPPAGSDSCSPPAPNNSYNNGSARRSANPDRSTLDFGQRTYADRASDVPVPSIHQGLSQSPVFNFASAYSHQDDRVGTTPSLDSTAPWSGDAILSATNHYTTLPLAHAPVLDVHHTDAVSGSNSIYQQVPVHVVNPFTSAQNPSSTQKATRPLPRPRIPESILSLSSGNPTDDPGASTASKDRSRAPPQPSQRPSTRLNPANKHGASVDISDEEISDALSATASNYPLESDGETVPQTRATRTTSKGKRNQPALEDNEAPEDEVTNTARGKSRGGGQSRGTRGRGRSG